MTDEARPLEDYQGPILAPGKEVAPGYENVAHLRRGKRLDVYDVWSTERACRCIAKTIAPDRVDEQRAHSRLLTEGELLCRFTHPNIVRGYEITRSPDGRVPVVILETLTGHTLGRLLDDLDDGLDVTDVAWLGIHLCSALAYLHRHNVLHLDLKPDNIVSEQRRAKVIDLSIASPPGPCSAGTGTYDYLAPEQARGNEVSAKTDVWGLGVTLFETLTGTVPFDDDSEDDDSEDGAEGSEEDEPGAGHSYDSGDIDADEYPQATERAPSVGGETDLPDSIVRIVDACLEPEPAQRPDLATVAATLAEACNLDPRAPQVDLLVEV